jgi:hypothetical protein
LEIFHRSRPLGRRGSGDQLHSADLPL